MKVILVDDEPAALRVLSSLLSKFDDIEIIGAYTDPLEALDRAKDIRPEAVFLDMEMGKLDGLGTAKIFADRDEVEVVFITAYSEYALDAFEVNALDYLLKPIQERRLERTIERLRKRIAKNRERAEALDPKILDSKILDPKPPSPKTGDTKSLAEDRLKISSLGRFMVTNQKGEKINWRTQKTRKLFAYLWVYSDHPVNKSIIMEAIFPHKNLSSATALLHTTIYQLRKALQILGFQNGITYSEESYRLSLPIESDMDRLKNIMGQNIYTDQDIKLLLEVYIGDFLEEEAYSWAIGIQEGLRNSIFSILEGYTRGELDKKNITEVLGDCLNLMYGINPYSEVMAAMFIEYYGIQQKKAEMRSFFIRFTTNLWEGMGIRPMKSTTDFYRKHLTTS